MLHFNTLLSEYGIRSGDVRLLRHQQSGIDGLTPYALWRDRPDEFERYQSAQRPDRRAYFTSPLWASFVVPLDGSTLFAGLYEIGHFTTAPPEWIDPLHRISVQETQRDLDIYSYRRVAKFDDLIGRLRIEWGDGKRSWGQRADKQNKTIVELSRAFREPDFPGYMGFLSNLAALPLLPVPWTVALRAARGVYLLTCPKTKEQYVGSAYGADGFWGRWQSYVATGHGGNVGLKSRDPSDYQISILEVAGSATSIDNIITCEALWKAKLQSREMGLNRN